MKEKTAIKTVFLASFLAVLVSLLLLYQHYSKEPSKYCNFSESFSCDVVNKGEYSTIDGVINLVLDQTLGGYHSFNLPIPNALISFLIFLFILGASIKLYNNKPRFGMKKQAIIKTLQTIMVISWLYAFILIYIEAFVLQSWCIFCLTLNALMLIITIAIFSIRRKP